MKTLMYDIARCGGRSPATDYECPRRFGCQRYLAFAQWDRAAGIENYRGIAVMAAQPECDAQIVAEALT